MRMLLFLAAITLSVQAQTPDTKPYVMGWRDNAGALVDVSFLLDAPAGQHGFVTTRGGHLAKGNGERLRL